MLMPYCNFALHPKPQAVIPVLLYLQGSEAGGHRGTFYDSSSPYTDSLIPKMTLLSDILQHVKVPVLAAGGIMNGQQIVQAIEAGELRPPGAFANCIMVNDST